VLKLTLIVLGWWSWLPDERGGDQGFFSKTLQSQGLIREFQKFHFPVDDRGIESC
jgi:hypothetical protein